jgi:hypothetical protein
LYKAAGRKALLIDYSYYQTFLLSGTRAALETFLQRMTNLTLDTIRSDRYSINVVQRLYSFVRYTNGARKVLADLHYADQYPYQLIAPITLLWLSSDVSTSTVLLNIHPAASDEAKAAIQQQNVELNSKNRRLHLGEYVNTHFPSHVGR